MNINAVILEGNLTRDPELTSTASGTPLCRLRIAVNSRRKDQSGNWYNKPNFFDVTVWGNQAENCAEYLSKGRPVLIHGRLDWHEWETQGGEKRQAVEVVAQTVRFLGGKGGGATSSLPPVDESDYAVAEETASGASEEDDIPF